MQASTVCVTEACSQKGSGVTVAHGQQKNGAPAATEMTKKNALD
jgi:hypothetical protein